MTDPALPFELGLVSLGNHAFEGNNNAYVLGVEDDATPTLVDTGISDADTRRQLREGLARYDLEIADVEQVFLTTPTTPVSPARSKPRAAVRCTSTRTTRRSSNRTPRR